jgi:TolB-like protein/DNA-binding winged helix-turn-helix (wHTH) protein
MSTEHYSIGGLELNAGTQEVTRKGTIVPLPPLSFALLLTLARKAPNVVTTRELEDEVWSGLVIDRGTINKRVVLVRNALRKAGCDREYISVVRGTGYRLAVPVQDIDENAGPADADTTSSPPPAVAPPLLGSLGWLALTALLVLTGFLFVRDLMPGSPPAAGQDAAAVSARPGYGSSGSGSIAVLPFVESNDQDGDTYFAEGMAREITRRLEGFEALDVASSSSSFEFRDSPLAPGEIAAQLGVKALLAGTVERANGRLVVTANLLDAENDRVIWSDRYDRPVEEVFRIQDLIADGVLTNLKIPRGERDRLVAGVSTANIDAYTLYLRGRSLLDKRIASGAAPLLEALESFEAAAGLDPNFVNAYVGIASASFLMPSYDPLADRQEWLERAEASARYALDLDPDSPEAFGVLAAIVAWRGDPLRAAGLFELALDMGNRDSNVLHWHAMLATSMGYFEGVVPGLSEAYRLDPLNQLLGCSLAGSLNFSGNPDEALVVLDGMSHFSRRDLSAAVAHLYLGNWSEARELLSGIELRMGSLPPYYAGLLVDAFENPLRRAFVEDAFLDGAQRGELPVLVAFEAMLVMGSPRAFDLEPELAGSYFEHRLPEAVWHNWGVELRQDPRFKGWVRALGYDQHWRKYGWPDRCRPTGLNDFECI